MKTVSVVITDQERLSHVVDIWQKTVDVQQHFNDLELRIRNFAVTILAAVLGLTVYAIKDARLASAVFIVAIVPWLAFYFMDRFHYHPLLYGAVEHGESIEDRWKDILPELLLTTSISRHSPLTIWNWKMRSPRKIDFFYGLGVLLLVLMAYLVYPK